MAGGRTGRPVDLQKQPVGDEKLLDAVMRMMDKYQPWVIIVHAGQGEEKARPMQLSQARGFVAVEDVYDDDDQTNFVTALVEKQQAGGRLAVVVGHADLRGRFTELLKTGACELIGGRRTHDETQYLVTSGTSLREYLGVMAKELAPQAVLAAAAQESLLRSCGDGIPEMLPTNGQKAAEPEVLNKVAEMLCLRSVLLRAWWTKTGVLMKLDRDKHGHRITIVINREGQVADYLHEATENLRRGVLTGWQDGDMMLTVAVERTAATRR